MKSIEQIINYDETILKEIPYPTKYHISATALFLKCKIRIFYVDEFGLLNYNIHPDTGLSNDFPTDIQDNRYINWKTISIFEEEPNKQYYTLLHDKYFTTTNNDVEDLSEDEPISDTKPAAPVLHGVRESFLMRNVKPCSEPIQIVLACCKFERCRRESCHLMLNIEISCLLITIGA